LAEYVGVLILLALISVPACLWGLWGLRGRGPGSSDPPPAPAPPASDRRAGAGFFLAAVVFLVFQAGILVLIPWALAGEVSGPRGLAAAAFGLPLGVGFVYLWRRGALRW